ncbi:AbiTii domain-containing protein [Klebsiella aerogenes]|uniref:AbiTii domain-containing protein n=1 Tax=Klebsiella aerogenes TaxID=548 RepID=UPI00398C2471
MSLLREIQQAATDPSFDLPSLLRKCKILASRLGSPEFKQWVNFELNGYPDLGNLILPSNSGHATK